MSRFEREHILKMQTAYQEQQWRSVNEERAARLSEEHEQEQFIQSLTDAPDMSAPRSTK